MLKPPVSIEEELPENEEFNQWIYTTWVQLPNLEAPLSTQLLYQVCDKDQIKFEKVIRSLQLAFEAGQQTSKDSK